MDSFLIQIKNMLHAISFLLQIKFSRSEYPLKQCFSTYSPRPIGESLKNLSEPWGNLNVPQEGYIGILWLTRVLLTRNLINAISISS